MMPRSVDHVCVIDRLPNSHDATIAMDTYLVLWINQQGVITVLDPRLNHVSGQVTKRDDPLDHNSPAFLHFEHTRCPSGTSSYSTHESLMLSRVLPHSATPVDAST